MLSMCGLICRFFHGWRQSEAVALIRQVAVLSQTSLLVEKCDQLDIERTKTIYCQPLCGLVVKKQLLWRENNKQVVTVSPKEKVHLMGWTKFGSGRQQGEENTEDIATPIAYKSPNEITVFLEATYNNKSTDQLPDDCITVIEMADLYAWRCADMFGIIIKTTPSQLVSLIHAFFNGSLFLEESLQICKMSTVITSGHPKVAEKVCTDKVKQIVHNLENQIANVKFRSKKSSFASKKGALDHNSKLSERLSNGPISSQPSTSNGVFHHSIHNASDKINRQLGVDKLPDEGSLSVENKYNSRFPELDLCDKKVLNRVGFNSSYYPLRIRSEADIYKATRLIRGNLANIVEKYLSKLEVNTAPVPNAIIKKLSVMTQFYVPRDIPRSIDDCAICNFHRIENNNIQRRHYASDNSPETKSESALKSTRFIGNKVDSSFSKVFTMKVDSSAEENLSPNEIYSDSLNDMDFNDETIFINEAPLSAFPMLNSLQQDQIMDIAMNKSSYSFDDHIFNAEFFPSDERVQQQVDDLTEDSFSSDSLVSPKSIKLNIPSNYALSSPEDTCQNYGVLDFPSHWRDEYEKIFAPVNNAFSKDVVSADTRRGLQPISEVDTLVKGCPPDYDIYPPVEWSGIAENYNFIDYMLPSTSTKDHSTVANLNTNYLTDQLNDFCIVDDLKDDECSTAFDRNNFEGLQCDQGESVASCEYPSPNNKFSPADSVPESGFASLRDSEYNNSEAISDVCGGLSMSKSRDSFDGQDYSRTLDNFAEESVIGFSDSIPHSNLSSTRGSISDNILDQENIKAAFQKNFHKSHHASAFNSVTEEVVRSSFTENSIKAVDSVSSCDTIISVSSNLDKLQAKDGAVKEIIAHSAEALPTSASEVKENQCIAARNKWYLESEIDSDICNPTACTKRKEVILGSTNGFLAEPSTRSIFINMVKPIDTPLYEENAEIKSQENTGIITHISSQSLTEINQGTKESVFGCKEKFAVNYEGLRDLIEAHASTSLKSMDSKKSCESSLTSNSSSDVTDRVSLKSADSSDSFPHFDSVRANQKPKRKHKKILLIDREDSTDKNSVEITRKEDRAKRKKQKKLKKDEGSTTEKKFAFKSLKEFLKVNKSKDKEPKKEKIKSPSLLKRFENMSKNVIQKEAKSSKRPTILHNIEDFKPDISMLDNVQGHYSRSVLNQNGKEDNSGISVKTALRKLSHSESPDLYRRVLLKNMSSSQESIDAKLSSRALPNDSSELVMGPRSLDSNSFSVTIGFKPHIEKDDLSVIDGADLQVPMDYPEDPVMKRVINKKSSSMEILVCGKIKEHGIGRRKSTNSREGSFRLHREISVETLFEDPEYSPRPVQQTGETYQEFLRKVRHETGSRQSSNWSLWENGSMESLPSACYKTRITPKNNLPPSMRLSELAETSISNPNLAHGWTYGRGSLSQSSSFTNSPYRRHYSSSTHSSPIKRTHSATPGKSLMCGNDSIPTTSLVEEDETVVSGGSSEIQSKPPNILIYAGDNVEYYSDVKETVLKVVNNEKYVVYHLTNEMAFQSSWRTHSALIVICGDVTTHIDTVFIRHLLEGGQILSICSDFLKFAVPLHGNVEFAESSVVSLSYGKWKNVQLLHHKHCFHSSPKHGRNSNLTGSSAVSIEPSTVEVKDEFGTQHKIGFKVLATDNTWGAPALLLADVNGRSGKAIFSQVHLERNPQTGISDRLKACHLQQSNYFRLQILRDLLGSYFNLDVTNTNDENYSLTPAYLIGDKSELVNRFTPIANKDGVIVRPTVNLRFHADASDAVASETLLPVVLDRSPAKFSAVKYFQTLQTSRIGRLAIYSDIVTSGMDILSGNPSMPNGFAVICSRQTKGRGRSANTWISPKGCALISVQLHITNDSLLGKRLPFLQHLVSMAACLAIKRKKSYEWMPLRLKWPNDIYMGEEIKIGGVLIEASMEKNMSIVNVGLGISLDNSNPTICINDKIRIKNKIDGENLATLELETYVADVFNCLEQLVDKFQDGGPEAVFDLYYSLWLHTNANIQVRNEHHKSAEAATVIGIDEFGFLVAQLESGHVTNLHPDGNSFDMMHGLVYQK